MTTRVEIPFPPPRPPVPSGRIEPPMVSIEPRWEYKEVARNLHEEGLLSEAELNTLGAEHWELAGVVTAGHLVHFYFKRGRPS
jgi:hypothetical protein